MRRPITPTLHRALAIPALLATVHACQDVVEPSAELRPAEVPPLLDMDSVVVGEILFGPCSGWRDHRPFADRLWVDVYFGGSIRRPTEDRPDSLTLVAFEAAGAEILHTFNFRVARMDVPVRVLEEFRYAPGTAFNYVRQVPYRN